MPGKQPLSLFRYRRGWGLKGNFMRGRLAFLVSLMLLAPSAHARQVRSIQPLALAAGQPVRITGMDLEFSGPMLAELPESDAKAAHKRI